MRRTLPGVLALSLLAASLPARADKHAGPNGGPAISAADFYDLCQANAPGPRNACGGLLVNYLEVHVLLGSKDESMRMICPARRLPADQARFLFNNWAEKRRDLAKMDVAQAITEALLENFPCRGAPNVSK